MTRTSHTYNANCPIPADLQANNVINVLHFHENLLTLQPQIASYSEVGPSEASGFDAYFDRNGSQVKVYEAIEKVTILPGIGDWGKYPTSIIVSFQNTADGLKSRAVAPAGVVVTATYAVQKRTKQDSMSDTDDGNNMASSDWVLCQNVVLECSSWLMPFVKQNMEGAQRCMCQGMVKIASLNQTRL
ncbi:hypothetical protein V8C35DRAFT_302600 [Trichoderma chlorosporum]